MYSHIMGLDEELWDVLEDDVGDLVFDEEGVSINRKKHTATQKKMYKNHHKIRGIQRHSNVGDLVGWRCPLCIFMVYRFCFAKIKRKGN